MPPPNATSPANLAGPPTPAVDIAGVPVAVLTTVELTDRVVAATSGGAGPRLITYANAWTVVLANRDDELARVNAETAWLTYADGKAVVWAARLLGRRLPERVNAGDFWYELLERLSAEGRSVYLLGGRPGVAEAAAQDAREKVPGLEIAGAGHGFFSDEESEAIEDRIRTSAPSVLFVGIGSPRQETWAAERLERLGAPVVWCVGALFEYYAGARRRAPVWMRRCGLEWLFRLAIEPRRLWRRYLIGNLRFTWLVARSILSR